MKFMMMAAVGLAAFATLTPAPAHAAVVFPGASCRAVGQDNGNVQYDVNGRVYNRGTSPVTVVCPIVRQNETAAWSSLKVVLANRNSSQTINCKAYSGQVDGNGYAQSLNSTAYNPEWYQFETLTFTPPTFVRAEGTYYLTCTLPPMQTGAANASMIMSYTLAEACKTATGGTDTAFWWNIDLKHSHGVAVADCM